MCGNKTKDNLEHMGVTYDKLNVFETDATVIELLVVPLEVNQNGDVRPGRVTKNVACVVIVWESIWERHRKNVTLVKFTTIRRSPYITESLCLNHLFDI
jgi:hypothetical protein